MESPESDIGGGAGAIQHKNTAKEINPKQSEEFILSTTLGSPPWPICISLSCKSSIHILPRGLLEMQVNSTIHNTVKMLNKGASDARDLFVKLVRPPVAQV